MKGLKTQLRISRVLLCCALSLPWAVYCAATAARGQSESTAPAAREPITISATFAQTWQQEGETVYLLRGGCRVVQGDTTARAERMVLFCKSDASRTPARERITAYLEEGVRVDRPGNTLSESPLLINLTTDAGHLLDTARPPTREPADDDPAYLRAVRRRGGARQPTIRRAQFSPEPTESIPELQSVQIERPPGGLRRFRIFSRTGGGWDFESRSSRDTTPPERIMIFTGGINLLIDGVEGPAGEPPIGTIDLSADRVVIWTDETSTANFTNEAIQERELPLQLYLEGNIVIRQGTSVLRASQGFYDVREERALLLNAELRTRIADSPALVRVRAQQLRQLARDTYQAQQAWITTSEFGKPGYRLQASDIFVEPRYDDPWLRVQPPRIDPETGEVSDGATLWATTLNNTFLVEDVPLFYFPYLSVPAEDPNIPLRNINVQNDRIFGVQVRTTWDMFKLLGIDSPDGVRWDLNADYLSKRGPQIGTSGSYRGVDRLGLPGPYQGQGYLSFIYDHGTDNLGRDRLELDPAQNARGGALIRDRQELPYGMTLFSEFGFVSDRNWLEQYREQEYDNGKDYETLIGLRQQQDHWSWSAMVRPRLYNYYNETAWLPRGDLYVLGQPLFGGLLTWSSHSYAAYATSRIADTPTDPRDKYSVLPFEGDANSAVLATRHQLELPFQLGALHFVPYALGEAAYWSDTAVSTSPFVPTSTDLGALDRLYGSAGVRASLEMWRVFPEVHSDVFYLNGLAHKMVFDADYSYSQSTASLGDVVPQFNEFDDNSQEQFRRRLFFNTFGGSVPAQFEPRFFAVREGVAQNVTAPYNELVDDLHVLRLGWRHRLQTKTGPVNAQRIKNWMTLDLETSFFPDQNRDNFGEAFGLYSARYNWYVGDRTTITAGTLFDTYHDAEHLWNIGLISQRSARGSVYLGFRQIEGGPLRSQIVTASYSYLMSPKWVSTASMAYDVGEHLNRGQSLTITRIGADFLVHVGLAIDTTKNNVGVGVSIEPRFSPFAGNYGAGGYGTQLGSLLQSAGR